jgi:hypothetical protein
MYQELPLTPQVIEYRRSERKRVMQNKYREFN